MTSKTKATYWQKHLSHWQKSGLTQKDYCTQHTLKQANFSDWRKRLTTPATPNKLIPLTLTHPSNARVVISIASIRIEVPVRSLEEVLPVIHRSMQEYV